MNRRFCLIFVALTIMLGAFSFPASSNEHPEKLKGFVEKRSAQMESLQGGVVAVFYKGVVIYKKAFGKKKGHTGSMTPRTLFPLASVSKPIAATAIALLVDQGAMNFEEEVELPYLKHPVSLVNILGHTTGYKFQGNFEIEKGMSRQQILNLLKKQKPEGRPGKRYAYSNTMFGLVEEAANSKNLSLQAAIEGLRNTLGTDGIQILPLASNIDVASPHSEGKTLPFPPYYPKTTPAAAGVFASLDGMIAFFKLAFGYRPDVISQKTLDALYAPRMRTHEVVNWRKDWPGNRSNIESYYGLGWRILKSKEFPGQDLIFHSGYIAGINTFIGFMPAEEVGILILLNQKSDLAFNWGTDLWREFLQPEEGILNEKMASYPEG